MYPQVIVDTLHIEGGSAVFKPRLQVVLLVLPHMLVAASLWLEKASACGSI